MRNAGVIVHLQAEWQNLTWRISPFTLFTPNYLPVNHHPSFFPCLLCISFLFSFLPFFMLLLYALLLPLLLFWLLYHLFLHLFLLQKLFFFFFSSSSSPCPYFSMFSSPSVPLLYPFYTPSVPLLYPFCTPSLPLLCPIFTPSVPHLYPFCTPSLPPLYPFYCFSCFILSLSSSSIFSFQHYHYLKAIIIKIHAGTQLSSFSWSERSWSNNIKERKCK